MKKSLFLALLSLCLLLSCASTNVFNEDLPLEQSAVLAISPYFTVKTYNDIPVEIKTAPLGFGNTGFTIPAGNTTLVMDFDSGRAFGNTRYFGTGFSLTYNFLAGNEYNIAMLFVDKEGNYKATNLGETYIAIIVYQGKDPKENLLVIRLE